MSQAGIAYMKSRSLFLESAQFVAAINNILAGQHPEIKLNTQMYNKMPVIADIHTRTLPAEIRRRLVLPSNVI